MLDSSIIGKVVDYGKYLCVIDSILDYEKGIVQLRIAKGEYVTGKVKGYNFGGEEVYINQDIFIDKVDVI